jgi:hypothetical protein
MILDYAFSTFNLTHPQLPSSKEITSAEFNAHLDTVIGEILSKWHPAKLIREEIKDDTPQLGRSALLDIFLTHKNQFITSYYYTDWSQSYLPEGLPIYED